MRTPGTDIAKLGSITRPDSSKARLHRFVFSPLIGLLLAACAGGGVKVELTQNPSAVEWSRPRGNDAGTAYISGPARLPDKLIWKAKTSAVVRDELTAGHGIIIAPTLNGRLMFYDANSGDERHEEEFDGPVTSAVFTGDTIAFAVDGDKPRVFFWDVRRQIAYRELEYPRAVVPPVKIHDGWFVQTYFGTLLKLNPAGDTVWTQTLDTELLAEPVVFQDRIFLATGGREVFCFDAETGDQLWRHSSAGAHEAGLAVDSMVYLGSLDSNVYALNKDTGEMEWFFHTGGQIFTTPAVDGSRVYFGSNDGYIYALNKYTGQAIWRLKAGLVHNSSPVIWGSALIFGASDGRLLCLDKATGDILRSFETKGSIYSPPIIYTDKIYITDSRRRLYCFGPAES